MTPSELQHLRELCERATPCPWRTVEVGLVRDKQTFTVLDADEMWVADCGAAPHDAAFIAAARSAVPALIEEVEGLQTQLGHEREHSKMLSDSNSALFIEKARVEDFCAKVRGQYTEAHAQVTRLASALAEAERGRDAYRAMVADLLASAHPYPTEHPTMAAQWKRARDLLKNGPRKEAGQ